MDSDKHSLQFTRLDVLEKGRRRYWSDDEKLRIVEESCAGRGNVTATAKRHNISRFQLATWRRKFGVEKSELVKGMPVTITSTPSRRRSWPCISGVLMPKPKSSGRSPSTATPTP
ncbi:transposase [Dongia sp.]|uniref:transposase n=1 Tax=Dongia sp. TaxID=1977262 RepID=UPI0035B00041